MTKKRADGFLADSRAAWAQTGNGLRGRQPVRPHSRVFGADQEVTES